MGPFVAFLVTRIDSPPTFAQVLSIVLKVFLKIYFSLLIKINKLLLCHFGFAKRPTIKEFCVCYGKKKMFQMSINLRLDVFSLFILSSVTNDIV